MLGERLHTHAHDWFRCAVLSKHVPWICNVFVSARHQYLGPSSVISSNLLRGLKAASTTVTGAIQFTLHVRVKNVHCYWAAPGAAAEFSFLRKYTFPPSFLRKGKVEFGSFITGTHSISLQMTCCQISFTSKERQLWAVLTALKCRVPSENSKITFGLRVLNGTDFRGVGRVRFISIDSDNLSG